MNQEIIIRIFIEQKGLSQCQSVVQSQVMPHLRLAGDAGPMNNLSRHINSYGEWLTAKGNDPLYIQKTTRKCRKVCLDLGWLEIMDISDDAMIAYLARLKEQRRAAKTRNHYRDAVCGWVGWMHRKGLIERNPIELVPKARETDKVMRAVPTAEQVTALIQAAKGDKRKKDRWLVYAIAAGTGLRFEEIRSLTVAMYRDNPNSRFELPASATKSRKPQTAFIPDQLAGWVQTHIEGKGLDDSVVVALPKWEGFERDRKRAGIPKVDKSGGVFSFHSLRHYFNNTLADADIDSETRRKLMRHGSLHMTERVYTRTNAERLSKKINQTTFFSIDDEPPDPIYYTTKEPTLMHADQNARPGTEVRILPPRFTRQTTHDTETGTIAGGCHTPANIFDWSDFSGSIVKEPGGCGTPFPASVATNLRHPSPNDQIVSVPSRSPHGLPDSKHGSSHAAAIPNHPTVTIADQLARAYRDGFDAGVRFQNGE